jgi:hypothetical protein
MSTVPSDVMHKTELNCSYSRLGGKNIAQIRRNTFSNIADVLKPIIGTSLAWETSWEAREGLRTPFNTAFIREK